MPETCTAAVQGQGLCRPDQAWKLGKPVPSKRALCRGDKKNLQAVLQTQTFF